MAQICEKHNLALAADGKCVLCRRSERPSSATLISRRVETTGDKIVTVALLICMVGATGSLIWLLQQDTPDRSRGDRNTTGAAPVAVPEPPAAPAPTVDAAAPDGGPLPVVKPITSAAEVSALAKAELTRARQQRIDEARARVKVHMYSTEWCTICDAARFYLQSAGVDFEEQRIDLDDAAAKRLGKLNDAKTVPTFTVGKEVLIGYNAYEIEAKIAAIARAAGGESPDSNPSAAAPPKPSSAPAPSPSGQP